MASELQGTVHLSNTISTKSEKSKEHKKNNVETKPGTSYEVFRNNTTAVEVIVKEIGDKGNRKALTDNSSQNTFTDHPNIARLKEINKKLVTELNKSNSLLAESRKDFRTFINVMSKQLAEANDREIEIQSRYLNAQLENEKFKTLLEYKTNLVKKFKRELISLRRIIKFVVKGISCFPNTVENFSLSSYHEYDEFERVLKKDCRVKFVNLYDDSTMLDSNQSRNASGGDPDGAYPATGSGHDRVMRSQPGYAVMGDTPG
ncbi:uncharacterized protein LOC113509485 [Galleria mellonella]|uniref:Uncharacterized protein LOC113509485 n=1 Tax=Galleria mellonella TaxID=7137 RepID=A0A6J1W7B4_GALME|nr:uncharacterized protein LOC113509485 [Galleria mellonella]